MKYKKIVIIGTGLIGGSVGKALLKKGLAGEVVGVCRRESSQKRALDEKAVTDCFVNDYAAALKGADIVVIATPMQAEEEMVKQIVPFLDSKTVVTDVGSTKEAIVKFAASFVDKMDFVGSHPLAGSETKGVENATAELFEGSICVVTPDGTTRKESAGKINEFWSALGATCVETPPDKHDKILAFTSHLPHVAAYALGAVQEEENIKFISTGFKDTTRIALSDPQLWAGILCGNKKNVIDSISEYEKVLDNIKQSLIKGDIVSLLAS